MIYQRSIGNPIGFLSLIFEVLINILKPPDAAAEGEAPLEAAAAPEAAPGNEAPGVCTKRLGGVIRNRSPWL